MTDGEIITDELWTKPFLRYAESHGEFSIPDLLGTFGFPAVHGNMQRAAEILRANGWDKTILREQGKTRTVWRKK